MNDRNFLSMQIVCWQVVNLFWPSRYNPEHCLGSGQAKISVIEKLLSWGCDWVILVRMLYQNCILLVITVCMWLCLLLLPVNALCVHLWAWSTIQYLELLWHLIVGKEDGQLLHQLSMLKMQLDPGWSVFRWMSCMWIGNSYLKVMVHSYNELKGKYAATMTWESFAF